MNENQKKQEMPLVIVSGVVFEQIKPGLKKAKLVTLPLREKYYARENFPPRLQGFITLAEIANLVPKGTTENGELVCAKTK